MILLGSKEPGRRTKKLGVARNEREWAVEE